MTFDVIQCDGLKNLDITISQCYTAVYRSSIYGSAEWVDIIA